MNRIDVSMGLQKLYQVGGKGDINIFVQLEKNLVRAGLLILEVIMQSEFLLMSLSAFQGQFFRVCSLPRAQLFILV